MCACCIPGILAGDELLLFGSVDADNFDGLESLGESQMMPCVVADALYNKEH